MAERLALGLGVLATAVSKLFVPVGLSISYAGDAFLSPTRVAAGLAALVVLVTFAVRAVRRRDPPLALPLFLFLAAMLPFLHLVPIGAVFGDRFLYLPSVAFVAVVAVGVDRAGRFKGVAVGAAAVAVAAFLTLSILRNPVFRSERALWEDAVAKDDDQAIPHYLLGLEYQRAGLLDFQSERRRGAIAHYQRSLEIDPRHPLAPWANLALGADRAARQHNAAAALRHYRAALEQHPAFVDALLHLAALQPSGLVTPDEARDAVRRALLLPLTDDQRRLAEQMLRDLTPEGT